MPPIPNMWKKECTEEWPLGIEARHLADGHYSGAADMIRMIVEGGKLPALNMEQITEPCHFGEF